MLSLVNMSYIIGLLKLCEFDVNIDGITVELLCTCNYC